MQAAHGALALTILGVAIGLLGWWQATLRYRWRNGPGRHACRRLPVTFGGAALRPWRRTYSALKTFRGAAVDGQLRTDFKGRLVIDMQLRHWIRLSFVSPG